MPRTTPRRCRFLVAVSSLLGLLIPFPSFEWRRCPFRFDKWFQSMEGCLQIRCYCGLHHFCKILWCRSRCSYLETDTSHGQFHHGWGASCCALRYNQTLLTPRCTRWEGHQPRQWSVLGSWDSMETRCGMLARRESQGLASWDTLLPECLESRLMHSDWDFATDTPGIGLEWRCLNSWHRGSQLLAVQNCWRKDPFGWMKKSSEEPTGERIDLNSREWRSPCRVDAELRNSRDWGWPDGLRCQSRCSQTCILFH